MRFWKRSVPDPPVGTTTSVSRSGDATTGAGGIANTGSIGQLNLLINASARGRYLEQVRRIAPVELLGRDGELAELAAFCTDPERAGNYAWWQAPAWAGKSALLSWFVLHPPGRTQIVSFFITGRLAGQNDRHAFLDNVIEQLAHLLGEPTPAFLTDANRDAHFLGLLGDAARACRSRDESFVLLVDGLDEDRGVTTGPDAHSIAGLLPRTPPEGMRVVVSGRANPPVPVDVDEHHPLRHPDVVRPLKPSDTARAVKSDLLREVKELLLGEQVDRELLGLLSTANGGLSADDLAELTERSAWEVEEHLASVAGRSFVRRPAWWRPEIAPEVYVLAHEELHATAMKYLGPAVLARHRGQLHDWAVRYQEAGWPANTPQYLLRDYHRMLVSHGDLARMAAVTADAARHDRLFLLSGGDIAAWNEIEVVTSAVLAQDEPDLITAARLAVHRSRLDRRSFTVPLDLPAVLARLGDVVRAVTLARSTYTLLGSLPALVRVVQAIRDTEDPELVSYLTGDIASSVGKMLESVTDPRQRAFAVQSLINETATVLDGDGLEALARSLPTPAAIAKSLVPLVRVAAVRGDADEADRLATDVEALLRSVPDTWERTSTLTALVAALGRNGHLFDRLADETRDLILAMPDPQSPLKPQLWLDLVRAVAESLDHARAEALTAALVQPYWRIQAVAEVAKAHAAAGHTDRARDLVAQARSLHQVIANPNQRSAALRFLVEVLAHGGELGQADELARSIQGFDERIGAQVRVLGAAVTAGALGHARSVTDSITDTRAKARALTVLANAELSAGDRDEAQTLASQAEWLVCTGVHHQLLVDDLVSVADALLKAGMPARVPRLLDLAEALTQAITDERELARAVASLAATMVSAGDVDRAEALARDLTDAEARAEVLAEVVKALGSSGDITRAKTAAEDIAVPDQRARAWISLAAAAAAADHAEARAIAARAKAAVNDIDDPVLESTYLSRLIDTAAMIGDHDSVDVLTSERELVLNTLGEEVRAMLEREPKGPLQLLPPPPGDLTTPRGIARRLESAGWRTALDALGLVCPEALTAAADELIASLGRLEEISRR